MINYDNCLFVAFCYRDEQEQKLVVKVVVPGDVIVITLKRKRKHYVEILWLLKLQHVTFI